MIQRRGWLLGLASALTICAFGAGCGDNNKSEAKAEGSGSAQSGAEGSEWRVGVYLSFSGEDTAFGTDTKEGIELAVGDLNKAGGIKGKPVKVLYEDDKSNAQEATNKVIQLITRDKVVAVIGEVASGRSKAGGIIANKNKTPMITPSSTAVDVTKVGPFVFRNCFTDDVQGRLGAAFVVNKLGKKKIGILFAKDDPYSSGLAAEFREEAKRLGAEIVAEKEFLKKETNFTTYINELKAKEPEVIYAPIYYNAMAQIARQAKAAGVAGNMFVGGDGWDADELLRDAGVELEGAYFTNHYAPDVPWENSKQFVSKYKERFKRDPSSLAAQGYDAARLLADAIGRSKAAGPPSSGELEKTRDEIRQAIQDTKGFQGATGTITINAERNADKPVVVVQIKDKKFTYYSTIGGGAAPAAAAPSAEPSASAAAAAPSGSAAVAPPKK